MKYMSYVYICREDVRFLIPSFASTLIMSNLLIIRDKALDIRIYIPLYVSKLTNRF